MSYPPVTVVMSVYNGAKYLRECLDSVLSQTFSDFEFIIVNDGSTDASPRILNDFARRDRRIVIIDQMNQGLTKSLNRGLSIARGKYVARMDADDIIFPDRLETQLEFMASNPDVGLLGTWCRVIDAAGREGDVWSTPMGHHALQWQLCFDNIFAHSSAMMTRSALRDANGYDERCHRSQDFDLWARLSRRVRIDCLPRVLVCLRRHDVSISATANDEQRRTHAAVCRDLINNIVQSSLSESGNSVLQGDNGCESGFETEAISAVLALYHAFMSRTHVGSTERFHIRKDAARRIWAIARRKVHSPQMWPALFKACCLDSAYSLSVLRAPFRRIAWLFPQSRV